jgi:D-arabinose 1-dehydrogenase-like Zn-dependent alcohol dehydrogenase
MIDAEYCTLRTEAAVRIPEDADPAEYAPLLCAGVTVFNGIRNMKITPGDIVAVQGLGGLGHLAIQYARKLGYRTVALSTSSSKKDFAMQLGANDFINTKEEDATAALQKMGGASLVVITAPNPSIMGPLVAACGPLGKVLVLARKYSLHDWCSIQKAVREADRFSCW